MAISFIAHFKMLALLFFHFEPAGGSVILVLFYFFFFISEEAPLFLVFVRRLDTLMRSQLSSFKANIFFLTISYHVIIKIMMYEAEP